MGQKAFRHLLETSITSVLATRSQDQRIGRREDGPGAPARERERAFVQVEAGVGASKLHEPFLNLILTDHTVDRERTQRIR